MIRVALVCAALSGCTHVQVLPTINPITDQIDCCVAYAEIPPSTQMSLSVTKSDAGLKVKAGAKWKF